MTIRHLAIAVVAACSLAGCGGSDDPASTDVASSDAGVDTLAPLPTVEVPSGATLCGTYVEEYKPILDIPTPFGEPGWEAEAQELVRISQVMAQLAPAEQASNASENARYFQALADVASAESFIEGSNAFNLYLVETCLATIDTAA